MSSSTQVQQTPNLNDRRLRLLEARLNSGQNGNGGGGGGSSNASTESAPINHLNTTYVPVIEAHSGFLLQQTEQEVVQSSGSAAPSREMLPLNPSSVLPSLSGGGGGQTPTTEASLMMKDESNVSVRSTSSEQNSREQQPETAPRESGNLSISSNSVSQMSVDQTSLLQPDGRKRKRGKNKEPSTSPKVKPVKNARGGAGNGSEGVASQQGGASAVSGSNGPGTPSSRRTTTDLYSKGSMAGSPNPSSSSATPAAVSLPRSASATTMTLAPSTGSRSPLHPATGLYASSVIPTTTGAPSSSSQPTAVPFLPSSNVLINNGNSAVSGPTSGNNGRSALTTMSTQTDLGLKEIVSLIAKQSSEKADKEKTVQTYEQKMAEMAKEIVKLKHKLETSEGRLSKCVEMEKKLLIEKSSMEKKSARSKSVHNRMKLGQFVTQREGANFEEKFLDGYAFNELHKRMDELTAEKEELDRRRKLLLKRKPTDKTTKKNAGNLVLSSGVQNNNDMDSQTAASPIGAGSQPFARALVGVTSSQSNGPAAANWATDFIQPEVREWTWSDYSQEDEILKLRTAQLKKDEQDCATELEKMERERLIHIRELKRIFNEDQSVFKNNPVLHSRYLLLTLIGKGGFSEVHKAFDMEEQRYVALKVHQLIKEWKDEKKANYIKHALREYHVHKNLTHPRVVKLFDVFEIDNSSFATVLEYVEGNDLDFYLKQQKTIPEREARIMISQVVSALKYFNELKPPIIHFDMKPGNILLGHGASSGEIKVTDFGLSKVCDDEHYDSDIGMDLTSQGAGTYWYLPPEVFETSNTPKISSKVDVWSVGVIFYQMLYGRKPYGDKQSQREVLQNFTILNAREVDFPAKPQISLEAKNFIRRCLTLRKDDRPEVRQLVHDDYLQLGTKLTKGNNPSVTPSSTLSSSSAGPSNHYG